MTCSHCGNRNNAEELRCRWCGRKVDDTLNDEFIYPRSGALAPQLQPTARVAERPSPHFSRAVQRPLFADSNVIPIAGFADPVRTDPPGTRTRTAAGRPSPRNLPRVEEQGSLDFLPQGADKPRTLGTTVEAVIYCEDPVATMLHRAVAAALDWSMVLIGYGAFLAIFRLFGGEFDLDNKTNVMMFAGFLPLLAFTYGLMWALAGSETPGMQWTHLHLTTFDGFRPEQKQLLLRFAGSCLSLCTVIGMLWSLADEENLAWQDHMSRTFPTPGLKSQPFLRR